MATSFLSGIKISRYGALFNNLHNAFHMGHGKYLNTLTSTYDLEIHWKGYTKGIGLTPNDSVAFTTESEEAVVHATEGVKMTQMSKPVIFHISGNNHSANRCLDREDGMSGKNADKTEDISRK